MVGEPAAARTTALLTSQWAVETDAGRAMPGNNFAGLKAAPFAAGAAFHTVEGHGTTRREVLARFRVYANPEAGAHDYVRLLATRYPAALAAARIGDASGFAKALADGGYFTADPAAYAAALSHRLAELEGASPVVSDAANASNPANGPRQWALEGLLHAFRGPDGDP